MWKKLSISHTVLFALLPVVNLFAVNLREFAFPQIMRSMVVLVIIGLLLLRIFFLRVRDIERAALLTSLAITLFVYYGHVYSFLHSQLSKYLLPNDPMAQINTLSLGTHLVLLLVWAGLVVGAQLIGRGDRLKRQLTQFALLFAISTFLLQAATIVKNLGALGRDLAGGVTYEMQINFDAAQFGGTKKSDIYYIVLDAYGREDILREFFGYDNSQFIDQLRTIGFTVADKSRSNYANTNASLASSLNMIYIDEGLDLPSDDLLCARLLVQSTASSTAARLLDELGYDIVSFATGVRYTDISNADLYLSPQPNRFDAFEGLLLQNSLFLALYDFSAIFNGPFEYPRYTEHRDRIAFTLENVSNLPTQSEPRFVFAHIVAPHPPFVFDAQGEPVNQRFPFDLADGNVYPGTHDEYISGYSDQITYLNNSLLEVVRQLTHDPANQPIILIQSDHGPRSVMDWSYPSADAKREGMGILNAYYMPDADTSQLYDEISPVNSFRVLFNTYFNADFDLLPDRSYMMAHGCQDHYTALPEESVLLEIQE